MLVMVKVSAPSMRGLDLDADARALGGPREHVEARVVVRLFLGAAARARSLASTASTPRRSTSAGRVRSRPRRRCPRLRACGHDEGDGGDARSHGRHGELTVDEREPRLAALLQLLCAAAQCLGGVADLLAAAASASVFSASV